MPEDKKTKQNVQTMVWARGESAVKNLRKSIHADESAGKWHWGAEAGLAVFWTSGMTDCVKKLQFRTNLYLVSAIYSFQLSREHQPRRQVIAFPAPMKQFRSTGPKRLVF